MLYESPAMADTLGRLSYAADRQLFAVVTADAGCGKSTLVRRFVETLPKEEYLLSNTPALFLCYQIFKGNPFFNHIVNHFVMCCKKVLTQGIRKGKFPLFSALKGKETFIHGAFVRNNVCPFEDTSNKFSKFDFVCRIVTSIFNPFRLRIISYIK